MDFSSPVTGTGSRSRGTTRVCVIRAISGSPSAGGARRGRRRQTVRADRLRESLQGERFFRRRQLLFQEPVACSAEGLFTQEQLALLNLRLQASRQVDRVADGGD